jgi:glutamate-1-semialdehyde 2,1-aminomutase
VSKVAVPYERACRYLAGGVSASTRLNRAVGHAMLFDRGEGCRLWDLDGKEYIDFCCSHGAALLGHGDPRVRKAVDAALDRGALCSYENELHTKLAELLCATVPCLERVRFTGSGTEATMYCLPLARAFTGRDKILKFEGNFPAYHDQVMFAIGTPADRLGPETAPAPYPARPASRRSSTEKWRSSPTTAPISQGYP